jgi:CheY-like chemotaxis protein
MARVMVVDDEKGVVELLTFMLQKAGHEVTPAFDGQSCLNLIKSQKPDLIVLDIMMPGVDGYTVFTKLEADDELRGIPVVILTARHEMRDVFALSAKQPAYVEKPFDPASLVKQVDKILSIH